MDVFAERRQRLTQSLGQAPADTLLVSHPINVSYLTGFTGDASYLLLTPDKTLLISDGRFTTQLAEECPGLETHIRPPAQVMPDAAAEVLGQLGIRSVEFDANHLTVADLQTISDKTPSLEWKPGTNRVEKLRQCKDASEVEQIRAAIAMAEQAFATLRSQLRPGDSEKQLADNLEHYLREAGASHGSFPVIAAVGPRAALPHAPPTRKPVSDGPLLLIDWGASGPFFYKSDLTRILLARNNSATSGSKLHAKIQTVYEVVLAAQQAAIAAARPGVEGRAVDAAARAVIDAAGYGRFFTHSIGHGLGMQVHEAPMMRPSSTAKLEAGMVITIEPGIYLPGEFGIRIEDDVLLTADGAVVLSKLPRDWDSCFVEF